MVTIESSPDESLTYRLKALTKIADRMSAELSREKLGVPYPEASIIGVIGTFGPQTIMDISRRANLDKSQASRTVDALLGKGILGRASSEEDGRSVIISLTAEGKRIFKKVGPTMDRRDKALFECLSEPEAEALRYLLDKILAANGWEAS
ncbi:MarR family transcriptional regulator [Paraburkholderia sp. LEh10]|jgi:DNA-binding MarR family transcriptional regulator|uniref:MarR family winged helix-turn-helix transcriptional regulator n=1 Tax=Paraburkholderia sp. LEh10 TaxID=2821353 RepID=UPI001AEA92A8|nr:MarR family transcriptional regulator [Paraburkholderia sp. LEh10]MBP0590663.1 MarR family transcriptional regulator [Paraburkholderia sp. LEh10]